MRNVSLKRQRAEMREITKSILDLVLARQNQAELVARVKESSGKRVENQAVEERLVAEMADYSRKKGLDNELAKKIMAELIEYSKIAQRKRIFQGKIEKHLVASNIRTVSVYGAGRMGRWFASYFVGAGMKVSAFDENLSKSEQKTGVRFVKSFDIAANADLHIVAVPIRETPKLIRKLAKMRSRRVRIIEVSSIKNGVKDIISAHVVPDSVSLYSIHPLFGSGANPFAENYMIEINRKSNFIRGLFPHYKILNMSVQEHDRLMTYLLTLPHLHALTFADTVKKGKIPSGIHSPSFDYMLELSKRLLSESERVYYEIQATNPYASKAFSETIRSVRKLQNLIRTESSFEKFFKNTRRELV